MDNTNDQLRSELQKALEEIETLKSQIKGLEDWAVVDKMMIDGLRAKNTELYQQNALLRQECQMLEDRNSYREARSVSGFSNSAPAEAVPAGGASLPMRSMGGGIPRDDGAAAAAAAGGGPSVSRSVSSHGVPNNDEWIVDKIPALYPSYAGEGWTYWEELPDGRYKWNPRQMSAEEELEARIAAAAAERNPRWTYGSFYPGEDEEN